MVLVELNEQCHMNENLLYMTGPGSIQCHSHQMTMIKKDKKVSFLWFHIYCCPVQCYHGNQRGLDPQLSWVDQQAVGFPQHSPAMNCKNCSIVILVAYAMMKEVHELMN